MQIRKTVCALAACAAMLTLSAPAAWADGKEIFTAQGCHNCHTVTSQGIEGEPAMGAPDLSEVGARHESDFIGKFIRKKAPLNGKMHMKKFSGTKAEWQELVTWLSGLGK